MEEKQLSRKKFLKGVGTTVASVAVVGAFGSVLAGCSTEASTTAERPEWPFPYKKMDPAKAEEKAFKGYNELGG